MSGVLAAMLTACALMGASGFLCLLWPRRWGSRDALFAMLMIAGGGAGATIALWCLVTGTGATYDAAWLLPLGRLSLRLDMLSAVFLVPVFLIPALGAVFGAAYWRESDNAATAPRLRFFYGLLPTAMAGVLLAQNGVLLLIAWEVMALAAFFAIAAEDTKHEVRATAWVYFVATHLGTLALLGFFTLLSSTTGSFELRPVAAATPSAANGLFVLGLIGFGVKAGIMPLHVWLPGAHANAPSHVSAVLSGVMLKVGVYGLFRVGWILAPGPLWWSWVLIGLGAASAVLGIVFALAQGDFKRLLAYSSIENIGIIVLGLGVAMLGRTTGNASLTTLGLAAAIVHLWNHSLFKSLLFFVSGALLHACGTQRMSALGGLAKRMPRTAAAAAVACIAITALPPLNGFVGEWLLYRGVIGGLAERPAGPNVALAVAVVAVALTGALALVAFVKFFGSLFLGQERSDSAAGAHDPTAAMLAPMGLLAGLCLAIGVLPRLALAPIGGVVQQWAGDAGVDAAALAEAVTGLTVASTVSIATAVAACAGVVWLRLRAPRRIETRLVTWDCGFASPSARMQYSESSFAALVVGLFAGLLGPRRKSPDLAVAFPTRSAYRSEIPDAVLDRCILPLLGYATRGLMWFRLMQQGRVQVHVLYILLGLLVLLVVAR